MSETGGKSLPSSGHKTEAVKYFQIERGPRDGVREGKGRGRKKNSDVLPIFANSP